MALSAAAAIAGEPRWPPDDETRARIEALRATLADPKASDAQRKAAREELRAILRTPGAPEPKRELPEPRAAIIPAPAIPPLRAAPAAPPPAPSVVEPASRLPAPIRDPRTGNVIQPAGQVAIDPKTGKVFVETPNGYIDPATGRFVPKQ